MNYWYECIIEGLDQVSVVASQDQIEELANWVKNAHENYGTAHGHDCIPHPANTAMKENDRFYKQKLREAEERETALKKNIASRYNCDVLVSVKDGFVEIQQAR